VRAHPNHFRTVARWVANSAEGEEAVDDAEVVVVVVLVAVGSDGNNA